MLALRPASQVPAEALEFGHLPAMMTALQTPLQPVAASAAALVEAQGFLAELHAAAQRHAFGGNELLYRDLVTLNSQAQALVTETLGAGEVSAIVEQPAVRLQETGFPGFWRVRSFDAHGALVADGIEVAPVPAVIPEAALRGSSCRLRAKTAGPEVRTGPALLTELLAASERADRAPTHVINLTLLPVSRDDISWLVAALQIGPVTLLSRGCGNCRIVSTRLRHTWWVQYFNSVNNLILNTIEVTPVPEAALAAPVDFADSLDGLGEWLATLE
ncbi:MAG TPA: hydrogenase expression/formation C-terminal domain-containing protein [Steroidobacteraceae bacterium]|nr:hydrogenase expression/formation C-terminal domain-containing protein [Steroidobacteraceae bacterium]